MNFGDIEKGILIKFQCLLPQWKTLRPKKVKEEKVLEIRFFGSRSKIYMLLAWFAPIFQFLIHIPDKISESRFGHFFWTFWYFGVLGALTRIFGQNQKIGLCQTKSIYILDLEPKNQISSTFFSFNFLVRSLPNLNKKRQKRRFCRFIRTARARAFTRGYELMYMVLLCCKNFRLLRPMVRLWGCR